MEREQYFLNSKGTSQAKVCVHHTFALITIQGEFAKNSLNSFIACVHKNF